MFSTILGFTTMILKCGKAGDLTLEMDKLHSRWIAHCVHKVSTAKCLDVHASEPDPVKAREKADKTMASLYDGSFRVKGAPSAEPDPVEALLEKWATGPCKAAYLAANGKMKGWDDAAERLIDEWIEARPHMVAKAQKLVADEAAALAESDPVTSAVVDAMPDPAVKTDPVVMTDSAAA